VQIRIGAALALAVTAWLVAPLAPAAAAPEKASPDCTIVGTPGPDVLRGTKKDDVICGLGGDDKIQGRGGDDLLKGGAGDDSIEGGPGDDELGGGRGDDTLDGRDAVKYSDELRCGRGRDEAIADGPDRVRESCEQNTQQPPTDLALAPSTVAENRPVGTVVGTLSATDADAGDTHAFTLVAGTGSADNGSFSVSGIQLRTAANLDFETHPTLSIRVRATDAAGLTFEKALTVTVTDADDPPTAVDDTKAVLEDAAATAIDVLANDTDTDGGPKNVASVTQPTHGAVVITGGGTGLTYAPAANYCNGGSPTDNFTYTLNGGDVGAVQVTVTCVDDTPVANDDSATVAEDAAATAIDVLANDNDPEGDPFTISGVTQPANGTVAITGGGTGLTYQPDADYCNDPGAAPDDTFTYTLTPGGATATVSVKVTCVDDAPVAVDDTKTVTEDDPATAVDVLANDTDIDGGPMSIASVTQPTHGTVVITGGGTALTYAPNPNYCNSGAGPDDTFTYTLNGGDSATVAVTVTCVNDAPVAVDDTKTVAEDSSATAIDVLANDTDSDGGTMLVQSVTQPTHGTVVITVGSTGLTYAPNPNYCNSGAGPDDTFTYTLNGGDSATVSVTVTCVDDPPAAVDDSASVIEDASATAVLVLANDTDPEGDPFTISGVTQPANGTVVITGGGSGLTYAPNANYCNNPPGTSLDTFTYTLSPGGDSATVTMTVTCVDDNPVAVNDTATVTLNDPATAIDVLANDTDIDGGPKAIASASDPAHGKGVLTGGSAGAHTGLTYQPDAAYCDNSTPDTFTYTLNGGSTATVSVTVACDLPPVAVNDSATVAEDSGPTPVDVLGNDTDADGGPKSVASVTQPANGTVVITGGGTGLTYAPNANYCNAPPGTTPDTFTYTLAPGGSTATVSMTVTCNDDPPVAVNDSATVLEDAAATAVTVLANDTDVDGGPKAITSASDPANGTVVVTGGGTGLTYQPDANYCNDPPGTTPDTFTYTLNGGSTATVSVTVTCAPDNPVVDTSAGSTSYTENAAATVIDAAVTVSDVDAGTTITGATAQITTNYAGAQDVLALAGTHPGITPSVSGDTLTLTGNASPAAYQAALRDVTYRNSSENPSTAARTVTFTVTDDTARSGSDTKGITVTAVDDPPVAVNDSATVLEDAAATAVPVLTNDTDVDAGPKSIGSTTQPANGTVVITGGGTGLSYQPNANYCNNPPGTSPDTFTYTLNGGSTATVSVTVTCVNDAPVADDETFNGASSAVGNTPLVVNDPDDAAPTLNAPKKSINGDILAGDTDVDSPTLTVTPGTFATNDGGSVTIEADGDFTYVSDPADACADASDFFDYTVTDGNTPTAGTDIGRVTIAVTGCVWYVSNNATGNAGTSTAPFDTLAQAETASAAGHTIFVFDGDNTTTGYAAGINLKANQVLTSEAANLVVGADTLWTAVAGARPTLTDNNADVVDLDDNTTVRGFVIDPQGTGGGIAGTTGDTGGGTIDNVFIQDAGTRGTQPGVELDATTGTFNVSDLTVNNGDANNATATDIGVRLNNAGNVVLAPTGTISVTTQSARALDIAGTALGTSTFDDITVTSSGSGGLSLVNTTGTIALGDDTVADISLTTNGANAAFLLNNAGTVTVGAGGTDSVFATNGPAIDITGPPGGLTGSFAFDDTDSTTSSTDGINLDSFGTGTFTTGSGSAITGAAGIGFDLNQGNANITYDGTINTSGASSRPVEVTNRGGGTVDFNGTVTGTDQGINLATNPSATIRFDGGIGLTTTTSTAFNATGGGTIVVTDPNANGTAPDNTLTATSATALNVASTNIGVGGLNFRTISAGNNTVAADPANGIVLNTTGAAGGLTVTGDGGAASNGSGGVIQNTTATGVVLTSTSNVSLGYMNVLSSADDGIHANGVTNFTLNRSNVNNNGNSTSDDGVQFGEASGSTAGALGTVAITNTSVNGNAHNNFWVRNVSGTLASLTVTGSSFNDLNDTFGANAFLFEASGTSTVTSATISGSTFQNNTPQRALEVQGHDTGTISGFTVSGNTFVNNGIHASFTQDTSANVTFSFLNNGTAATPMTGSILQAINVFSSSQATGGTLVGTISANRVGNPSIPGSAGGGGAISAVIQGQTDATLLIDGNIIRQTSGDSRAIGLAFRGAAPPLATSLPPNNIVSDVTVTNNDVVPGAAPSGFPLSAIMIEADNQTGADNKSPTVRADIRGNTVPTSAVFDLLPTQLGFFEYDAANGHGIGQLVDTAPASADATAQLTSTNTGTASAFGVALIPGPIATPP
jgi:VCBS repeat-containing protein